MASVNAVTGSVGEVDQLRYEDTSSGLTPLVSGDVLVAKITPCFQNGKTAQAILPTLVGMGSTEFHVIRAIEGVSDARYLLHFLRQPWVRDAGEQRMTGSGGQRRVPVEFFKFLPIPLPPIEEQRRIAAILDKADEVRTKRREAFETLETLTQSIFVNMFGDLLSNQREWPTASVEEVCELVVDCVNRTAPIVESPTPYKMIRTTNVRNGEVNLNSVRYVSKETYERWNRRATPRDGDVLLTREAPVGEAGILRGSQSVFLGQRLMLYRAQPERMTPEFLFQSFRSPFLRSQFDIQGSGSTVKHLPLPACRGFVLRLPPFHLQQEFARHFNLTHSVASRLSVHSEILDDLFASLQQRAFQGAL